MDEQVKMEHLRRMQDAMRPMTETEIADMQRRQAPLMLNNLDAMRGVSEMRNFWTIEELESHWIPDKPMPTFWQRLKRLLARSNARYPPK